MRRKIAGHQKGTLLAVGILSACSLSADTLASVGGSGLNPWAAPGNYSNLYAGSLVGGQNYNPTSSTVQQTTVAPVVTQANTSSTPSIGSGLASSFSPYLTVYYSAPTQSYSAPTVAATTTTSSASQTTTAAAPVDPVATFYSSYFGWTSTVYNAALSNPYFSMMNLYVPSVNVSNNTVVNNNGSNQFLLNLLANGTSNNLADTPEPASIALTGLGLIGFGLWRRNRK